jgi:two-component system sensor histidine kinase KdpD
VDDNRPNPDALLAAIQTAERRGKRGKLKIFLGMAPGVGKTYAMLKDARAEEAQGVDVVVGLVETHGRAETLALLDGLQIAPRRKVDYRGATLEEMDLDAVIFLRPELALVDELAHTNAAGSRHPKRYQDVLELLDLGIDVFTTLNVQHAESRAAAVRQATGVTVQETVPDSILEAADEIELIDLSPTRLRERLAEGKVYLGARAAAASDNFFKEENLVALREIALRLTAERVDHQLRQMRPGIASGSASRLMVAVGPSPFSLDLVRRTRRLAFSLNAGWIAVSIEPERPLSGEDQRQLDKNLALARELGAEVIFTRDSDVVRAILRVARENHVTQLVVGKSRGPAWLERWWGGSSIQRLLRESGSLEIHVIPPDAVTSASNRRAPARPFSWGGYGRAAAGVLATTGWNLGWSAVVGYWSLALFYLLAILLMGLRLARGPLILAAALSALLWDFLFIPPLYTFYIAKFEDGFMLVLFFVVALVTGQLTSRLRGDERNERLREQRASALYHLTRGLSAAASPEDIFAFAAAQIAGTFALSASFHQADSPLGVSASPQPPDGVPLDEKERSVAVWAYRNRRAAGRFTDTLASSPHLYLPLLTPARALGVLAIKPAADHAPTLGERDLLESFAQQIALALDRELLRTEAESARLLVKSDELHRSLFNSVSHELQTPLAVLQGGLEEMSRGSRGTEPLLEPMHQALHRLQRLVRNLLDSARLESGRLAVKREWGEVSDLLDQAIDLAGLSPSESMVRLQLDPGLPLLHVDFALVAQAVANVLHNAVSHGRPPVTITVSATTPADSIRIEIQDNGPGIPDDLVEAIFDRFVRAPAGKAGGSGLGLAIAKGFIEAHDGTIAAQNTAGGGACFIIRLPLENPSPSATLAA